jgi:hypothetical protein
LLQSKEYKDNPPFQLIYSCIPVQSGLQHPAHKRNKQTNKSPIFINELL